MAQLGETSAVTKRGFVRVERVAALAASWNSPVRGSMKTWFEMVAPPGLEPGTCRL